MPRRVKEKWLRPRRRMQQAPTQAVSNKDDFQSNKVQSTFYVMGRDITKHAINLLGLEYGMVMVLSGVSAELRRHLSLARAKDLLQGFVDTMSDDDDYDDEGEAK